MSVGEPQDAPPSWLADTVAAHARDWNRYPPAIGTPEFRSAARAYVERRYPATRNRIDPDTEVSPVTSTREGLYLAASIATSPSRKAPIALMQNPFYQTYRAAAIMAGAEPRYLTHSGFPHFALDLRELDDATLAQTSILYLCSPSNPDGNAIGPDVIRRAIEAARRHNFLVVFDECYAELYDELRRAERSTCWRRWTAPTAGSTTCSSCIPCRSVRARPECGRGLRWARAT